MMLRKLFYCPSFLQTQIQNEGYCCVFKFSGVVWTENMRFQSETPISSSPPPPPRRSEDWT